LEGGNWNPLKGLIMVKRVEMFVTEKTAFPMYADTEEEANLLEQRYLFKQGFIALEKRAGIAALGSKNLVDTCAEFVWKNKELIKDLFDGKEIPLTVEKKESN
jgi:hypothetical protein